MKILITGVAGFIGFHLAKKMIANGHDVIGLDNINDYYDIDLKYARLKELGITRDEASFFKNISQSKDLPNFKFIRLSLEDRNNLPTLFEKEKFQIVCNLAAQAGVRYSLENPQTYIDSNIVGFANILECCRNYNINHLVYASSSSVYGLTNKIPFKETDVVNTPISLYAATKKSNELMAHTYSHLYGMRTTGLRFFTVYGPWGRPDMAMFLFTDAIINSQPINIYNHGKMERDFTYIDDIVEGLERVIEKIEFKHGPYKVYNIGNNSSIKLMDFIETLEKNLGKKSKKNLLPIQPGDVEKTWADVDNLINDFDYRPSTPVEKGIKSFVKWYKEYYNII
ncbi:NAD-dependent epimerase [Maribacter algicola]|uniref:NAD-dependent epimerase n=1 Tax=Meishania litoralis TaxID=3434685 RepID=A0ACC7LNY1_9FLAO